MHVTQSAAAAHQLLILYSLARHYGAEIDAAVTYSRTLNRTIISHRRCAIHRESKKTRHYILLFIASPNIFKVLSPAESAVNS